MFHVFVFQAIIMFPTTWRAYEQQGQGLITSQLFMFFCCLATCVLLRGAGPTSSPSAGPFLSITLCLFSLWSFTDSIPWDSSPWKKNTTTWRRSFVFLTNHQTVANLRSCPPFFGCHGEYYPSIPLLKAPDQELPAEIHADMEVTSCYLEAPFFEIFLLKA